MQAIAGKVGVVNLIYTYLYEREQQREQMGSDIDYWERREQRTGRFEQDWVKQPVYVNIGGLWYEGVVQNVFLGDLNDPNSYFMVTAGWDSQTGETQDVIIPALATRIRLATDGPPTIREGGIAKFKLYTNPEDTVYQKDIAELSIMEQIRGHDGLWHEVKSVEPVEGGWQILFTDGSSEPYSGDTVEWRPRGRIHTDERPKQPKWDPKAEWLKGLKERGWAPKGKLGPKTELAHRMKGLWEMGEQRDKDELTDWEQALKMANIWGNQGMSKNPDDYYHQQNDGSRPDNFEYKESDWEQALKMAEIWGKQGMSKNPDDYYHQQNDGSRPEDFEYEEDTIADWGTDTETADTEATDTETAETDTETADTEATDTETAETDTETADTSTVETGTPISNATGHPIDPPLEGTEEYMKYIIDSKGFDGLENYFGYGMSTIYENYALGKYSWQHGRQIPAWLQPNLTNIWGGADKYKDLIKKYENDSVMSRYLERVGTGVRAPNVIRYLNTAHSEMRSLWHDGTIDADKIEHLTQGNAPGFAYNSEGHIVLVNDTTIDHGFNHNRNIVHTYSQNVGEVEHHQTNFTKAAESMSKVEHHANWVVTNPPKASTVGAKTSPVGEP